MAEDIVIWGGRAPNVNMSADGLTIIGTTSGFGSARANIGRSSGLRAFEIEITATAGSSRYGVGDATFALSSYLGTSANSLGLWCLNISPLNGAFTKIGADSTPVQNVGTRYLIVIDFTVKKGWVACNGVYRTAGANPATGAGADFSFSVAGSIYPACSSYNPGDGMRLRTTYADIGTPLPAGCLSWADSDGSTPPPPPPPTGQNGIGFLGDSITWYMDQGASSSASIFSVTPTFNYGVPSDTTAGMLSRVDTLIAIKPKMIFLLGGVNDYSVADSVTASNVLAIVNKCNLADVPIIVEGILPVSAAYTGPTNNAAITSRRNAVHAALMNYKGGMFLDWGASLTASDYVDGIHLSASGFSKRNSALTPYINLNR